MKSEELKQELDKAVNLIERMWDALTYLTSFENPWADFYGEELCDEICIFLEKHTEDERR